MEASDKAKADARKGGTTELIGTVLLSHFKSTGTGKWSGKLFVPDMNIRTKARLQQTSADQLKVSGCGPTGLVCQSQLWTRAN